jgi:hypothetical protein
LINKSSKSGTLDLCSDPGNPSRPSQAGSKESPLRCPQLREDVGSVYLWKEARISFAAAPSMPQMLKYVQTSRSCPTKNNAIMYHVCVTNVTYLCLLFPRLKINHKSCGSYTFILEKKGAATNNKCNLQGM